MNSPSVFWKRSIETALLISTFNNSNVNSEKENRDESRVALLALVNQLHKRNIMQYLVLI